MNLVNISVQIHGPIHINQESSNVLTVEAVVRPGEVAPIPNLEVELGALQPHQRLPHGGGEPVARAPAERSESKSADLEFQSRKQIKEDRFRCDTTISAKQTRTEI